MSASDPNATELKNLYTVYGSFYNIDTGREIMPCRNVLEIIRKEESCLDLAACKVPAPYSLIPEVIVVMMNPGSSAPAPGSRPPQTYLLNSDLPENIRSNPLTLAKPDITQFQIMKLMEYMGWQHSRILNLSDIRQPKSNEFFAKAKQFQINYNHEVHSIFSPERAGELALATKTKAPAPFIVGWGTNPALLPLARICIAALVGRKLIGAGSAEWPELYRHPSPTLQKDKDFWLDTIKVLLVGNTGIEKEGA